MIGRAAYANPTMLARADSELFGDPGPPASPAAAAAAMVGYLAAERERGGKLSATTRHLMNAFHGTPGNKAWKRAIEAVGRSNGLDEDLERMRVVAAKLATGY